MSLLSRLLGKGRKREAVSIDVVLQRGSGSYGYSGRSLDPGNPETCWVPPGQTVSIQGYDIPEGMLYVGKKLAGVGQWAGMEPALIDPVLPLNKSGPDRNGLEMGYWPSYNSISLASRAAYLEWLAAGRGPGAYVGYVFLFFYGLERRAISDPLKFDSARKDLPHIREEVNRLLSLYSDNRSFNSYASRFLDLLGIALTTKRGYETDPPKAQRSWEFPLQLKIGLAHLALDSRPMPPVWALGWLETDPETRLRTPAKRCPDEFRQLFQVRYEDRYGEGMLLKPNKTRISAHYRPASASFGSTISVQVGDLPDLTALSAPVRRLREIADECCNDLDAYSRWLGRNPDGRGSIGAVALLPAELAQLTLGGDVERLVEWVEGRLRGGAWVETEAEELIGRWPSAKNGELSKPEGVLLAQLLQKRGFGIEPDVRFGGPPLSSGGKVVIFRIDQRNTNAPSPPYVAATVLLQLAAAVSAADGSITEEEEEHLEKHMEATLELAPGESDRLRAHLRWLLAVPPGLSGMKKKLSEFKRFQRESIAGFLVTVAGADGHISPTEITTLSRVYGLLGLEPDLVFSHVHAFSTSATKPVTIQAGEPLRKGRKIPLKPTKGESFSLDMEVVAAKLGETAAVSALLANIFAETDEAVAVLPQPTKESLAGLDAPHSMFLRALGERPNWDRADIESTAARIGLLPDGALDLLNDVAFEIVGQPLFEGEDTLVVDLGVFKELVS